MNGLTLRIALLRRAVAVMAPRKWRCAPKTRDIDGETHSQKQLISTAAAHGLVSWGLLSRVSLAALHISCMMALPAIAKAQVVAPVAAEVPSQTSAQMTGNWGGLRTQLQQDGITLRGSYVAEAAGNPVGGRSKGVDYADQFEFDADIDFAKLAQVNLGTLSFSLTERTGQSLSANHIGDIEEVQEIYGSGENFRLSRLTLRRDLGAHATAGIGWNNAEEEFATSPTYWGQTLYCLYQSLGFCGKPPTLGQNSGYQFIPRAVPSAWLRLYPKVDRSIILGIGVYAVDPTIQNTNNGFKLGFKSDSGVYIPVELGWHRGHSEIEGTMPGSYRVGVYYDSSTVKTAAAQGTPYLPPNTSPSDLPNNMVHGRYGGWVLVDQMISRDKSNPHNGFVIWGSFTYGDPKTSLIPYYGAIGLARNGTFAGRPLDNVAAGIFVASVNKRLGQLEDFLAAQGFTAAHQRQESGAELNYGYTATSWFTLRPGVQYIHHPAGESVIADAIVLDLQAKIAF